ncbi:MAG: two-component system response regulator [Firmicutes bacterium HGW-Firmicutes-1]|jgi:two-component system chemotaxis response regulator CheY|nr:MAG: two-component system response regulator [Firmicutes bacterium HGW-Firmicutes-1]
MKKVLIVDDARFVRFSIKMILENLGFEIVGEAENGSEAVKMYHELKPDIVTMDISMPEDDGIEAIRLIKKIDKNAKIIVIASLEENQRIGEAMHEGAVAYIIKDFKEEGSTYSYYFKNEGSDIRGRK